MKYECDFAYFDRKVGAVLCGKEDPEETVYCTNSDGNPRRCTLPSELSEIRRKIILREELQSGRAFNSIN